jgi:hypothetical protein
MVAPVVVAVGPSRDVDHSPCQEVGTGETRRQQAKEKSPSGRFRSREFDFRNDVPWGCTAAETWAEAAFALAAETSGLATFAGAGVDLMTSAVPSGRLGVCT